MSVSDAVLSRETVARKFQQVTLHQSAHLRAAIACNCAHEMRRMMDDHFSVLAGVRHPADSSATISDAIFHGHMFSVYAEQVHDAVTP
jgi:hypothetical protein